MFGADDIVVFNCVLQSFVMSPAQIVADIGPRLVAMVRSFGSAA
jgi:hypothetical protein